MKISKFSELRDITQGDFAIRDGRLYYKDREIATTGTILLESSEEVFFLFSISQTENQLPFTKVIFQNYYRCVFYPCIEYQRNGEKLSFSCPEDKKYVFTRFCYNDNINSSKIIGGCRRN